MHESDFVTISEASKLLRVAPNTLRSWGAQGKIQEYRHALNNYRLYRIEDLESLGTLLKHPQKANAVSNPPSQSR